MPDVLALKHLQPLASGKHRLVYPHPADDDLLIKVARPEAVKRYWERVVWYKSWRRTGLYFSLLREIDEYVALRIRDQHELPFLQRFFGLVDTDIGLGLVVDKLRGRDGLLAPTLTSLVREQGLTAELRARIDELIAAVTRHHVVLGNFNANNVVHASDDRHGDRLVVVDGLGDRWWIPLKSMSPRLNRLHCLRRFRRAMRGLERLDRERAGSPPAAPPGPRSA